MPLDDEESFQPLSNKTQKACAWIERVCSQKNEILGCMRESYTNNTPTSVDIK